MTVAEFTELTGQPPIQDDLERVNCEQAGAIGHAQCGVCDRCGFPRFIPKFDGQVLICRHDAQANQPERVQRGYALVRDRI